MNTQTKTKRKRNRIWVTDEIHRELVEEFKVAGNTIGNALKFFSDSDNAAAIRKRAIEKMDEVNKNNKKLKQQLDEE
jgi:SOS response regulatory protein OraA/RecX